MLHIVFYFQVHQPLRLRENNVLDSNAGTDFFDEELNRKIIRKVGEKCYLPEELPPCPAIGCNGRISARKSRFGKTFFYVERRC